MSHLRRQGKRGTTMDEIEEKECPLCGEFFEVEHPEQIYCSIECLELMEG